VSGRPGPTEFLSSQYSSHLDRYNLTFKIESLSDLEEIKLLYRKLMVSDAIDKLLFENCQWKHKKVDIKSYFNQYQLDNFVKFANACDS
jgi:hypothetical protein